MKKKIILFTLSAFTLFSCSKDIIDSPVNEGKVEVKAIVMNGGTVTTKASSAAGSTSGAGFYNSKDPVTVTATPNSGYELEQFSSSDSKYSGSNSYTLPAYTVTFTAKFKLITEPESNCYILKPGSTIKIPVSRVNTAKQVAAAYTPSVVLPEVPVNWSATVLWSDKSSILTPSGTIESISTDITYGAIIVKAGSSEGNAVVCMRDPSGNILWSWHIWVTNTNFELADNQRTLNNLTWMDRNLGAMSINEYGFFYQWGRKDPFPRSTFYLLDLSGATGDYQSSTVSTGSSSSYKNLSDDVRKPHIFHVPYQNALSWGDSKTVFDPCPVGWKVPSDGSWNGLTTSNGSWTMKGTLWNESGVDWTAAGYYPAGGYKDAGGTYSLGFDGKYMSSTVSGDYVRGLVIHNLNTSPSTYSVNPSSNLTFGRTAYSVRCVRE